MRVAWLSVVIAAAAAPGCLDLFFAGGIDCSHRDADRDFIADESFHVDADDPGLQACLSWGLVHEDQGTALWFPGEGELGLDPADPDEDLDGILDGAEWHLARDCWVAGVPCATLGIDPPHLGVRDFIVVAFDQGANLRLSHAAWAEIDAELAQRGIALQHGDLGTVHELDVQATWDAFAVTAADAFWFHWLEYEPANEDYLGQNILNLIEFADDGTVASQVDTFLHEAYHAMLGDLDGMHSLCDDDEIGGASHSREPGSILFVGPDCEGDGVAGPLGLAAAEEELAREPFAALTELNRQDYF